ncbi:F sex factor N terminal family protein [Orientia chuto str. Dubai]|uniref:F sex factor N terminal family protein n=1 Tax=Orientia chuto str. Dubai TaxID=1359168 RepID=A0A0F3MKF7_9RICK|nr:TraD N-terminal domain-containing protein [Candidatus Orientia mediorientalis]KJV56268.1 F sex factor N terminal family protein [Orientia chuto str. Dubai]
MNFQNQGHFTRGSQLVAHKLRMFGQGSANVLTIGFGLSIFWILWRLYQKLFLSSLYYFAIERYVQLKLAIGEHFYDIDEIGIKFYSLMLKKWIYLNAQDFVYKFYRTTWIENIQIMAIFNQFSIVRRISCFYYWCNNLNCFLYCSRQKNGY